MALERVLKELAHCLRGVCAQGFLGRAGQRWTAMGRASLDQEKTAMKSYVLCISTTTPGNGCSHSNCGDTEVYRKLEKYIAEIVV